MERCNVRESVSPLLRPEQHAACAEFGEDAFDLPVEGAGSVYFEIGVGAGGADELLARGADCGFILAADGRGCGRAARCRA